MRSWLLKILLAAAAAAVIGCSQTACTSNNNGGDVGDYPYQGPLVNENGEPVSPPDWGN